MLYVKATGEPVRGVKETVPGCALASGIDENGTPIYDGGTTLYWDDQTSVVGEDERRVWVTQDGDNVSEAALIDDSGAIDPASQLEPAAVAAVIAGAETDDLRAAMEGLGKALGTSAEMAADYGALWCRSRGRDFGFPDPAADWPTIPIATRWTMLGALAVDLDDLAAERAA